MADRPVNPLPTMVCLCGHDEYAHRGIRNGAPRCTDGCCRCIRFQWCWVYGCRGTGACVRCDRPELARLDERLARLEAARTAEVFA